MPSVGTTNPIIFDKHFTHKSIISPKHRNLVQSSLVISVDIKQQEKVILPDIRYQYMKFIKYSCEKSD